MRRQQGVAQRLSQLGVVFPQRSGVVVQPQGVAHQRVAVGVQPIGRQAHQHVALADAGRVEQCAPFGGADHEARHVELAGGVHPGHLRRFAANQGAAVDLTGAGHALDQRLDHAGAQLAQRQVVEEEEGTCAGRGDVVHAGVHHVLADHAVAFHCDGQLEFGAYAVGARHQHRLVVAGQPVQGAESADAAEHLRPVRASRDGGDASLDVLRGVKIDPGGRIGSGVHGGSDLIRRSPQQILRQPRFTHH